jgi:hypothetical protein
MRIIFAPACLSVSIVGSAERMRVSSTTVREPLSSARGHVKVYAHKYALAFQISSDGIQGEFLHRRIGFAVTETGERCSTVLPCESCGRASGRLTDPCHLEGEVDRTLRVAPLVVVPADDLDEVAHDHGRRRVEDARMRIAHDVD